LNLLTELAATGCSVLINLSEFRPHDRAANTSDLMVSIIPIVLSPETVLEDESKEEEDAGGDGSTTNTKK